MRASQHEIPTHLNVEDKLLFGLTMRQFLYLLVGSSAAYSLWDQTLLLPQLLHVGLPGACLLTAAALALLQPLGGPLEAWWLAGALFTATARRATWCVPEPDVADWRPPTSAWQELAPDLVWADEEAPE